MLAAELGLRPGPRAQIVADIKRALVSLVDERGVVPIVILDDAQGLRDDLLHKLHGRFAGWSRVDRLLFHTDGVRPIQPPSPVSGRSAVGLLLDQYETIQNFHEVIARGADDRWGGARTPHPVLEFAALGPGVPSALRP